MKPIRPYRGYMIYHSAATHPNANTSSIAVFLTDTKAMRFRYIIGSTVSYNSAMTRCEDAIDKKITTVTTDTGKKRELK